MSRLLTDARSVPLLAVRAAARAALDVEGSDAATLFVRSGIFVAVERDESRIRQEQLARQQAREAKQRALAYLEIPATPELLELPDDQFIRRIGTLVTQPWATRVQAGVNAALRGEAPEWKAFIEVGVIAAHRADVDAHIQAQHDKTEAEKEALRQRDLKRRAASVVAWAPTEGELTLANDNFIRAIEGKAVAGSEVAAAALTALRSPEPAVWAAFIETGVHAASARDKQIALDRKAAADRGLATEIKARADNSLVHPALSAAAAALAGTPGDVDRFLRVGQFDALTQSLRTTSPNRQGWWVRSGPGDAAVDHPDPGAAASVPVTNASWKVVDGLAGEGLAECARAVSAYVVRNDGQLRLYQHADPLRGGFSWVDGAGGQIGQGWQMFDSMFSAGADILYGAHAGNGGELLWYRYLPATETWADTGRGTGKVVGTGWHGEYNLTAAPDGCRLS